MIPVTLTQGHQEIRKQAERAHMQEDSGGGWCFMDEWESLGYFSKLL